MAKKEWCEGYTTGSTATAGMKASLLALRNEFPKEVTVLSPQHVEIRVPIEKSWVEDGKGKAIVLKDGGDDMDVTHKTPIHVEVELTDRPGLEFVAGEGVGTVTKPGLQVRVGEPAINPGPRMMMKTVYGDLVDEGKGCIVTISVPAGKKLAAKTLNPVLGVIGGISIIGTSGIVKPMSEEAYKKSLIPQFTVLAAQGVTDCMLVPGRIGHDAAMKLFHIPPEKLVETSNFIGFMLEQAVDKGMKDIILIGHIGKLVKVASGSFHTHNRMSDGRMETLAAYAAAVGADQDTVRAILDCNTTDGAMEIIVAKGLTEIYPMLAERAQVRAMRYIHQEARVGAIFVTMDGHILAMSSIAEEIGRRDGWLPQ